MWREKLSRNPVSMRVIIASFGSKGSGAFSIEPKLKNGLVDSPESRNRSRPPSTKPVPAAINQGRNNVAEDGRREVLRRGGMGRDENASEEPTVLKGRRGRALSAEKLIVE